MPPRILERSLKSLVDSKKYWQGDIGHKTKNKLFMPLAFAGGIFVYSTFYLPHYSNSRIYGHLRTRGGMAFGKSGIRFGSKVTKGRRTGAAKTG